MIPTKKQNRIEVFLLIHIYHEGGRCKRRPVRLRFDPIRHPDHDAQPQCYHFTVENAGYVLVGGRSSRMGCDKALLPWRGATLAQRAAESVAEAAQTATLVGPPERYSRLGFPVIPDLFPEEGPLGGILTALGHSSAEWNLILACDMPAMNPVMLGRLLRTARELDAAVLLPVVSDGGPQPLCAVYRRTCLASLEAIFGEGTRGVMAALDRMRARGMRVEEMRLEEALEFQNVNTPEDWAAYATG
jgi:molybdopterin-guanine dinucleotide biosynthesis protein A